MTTHTTHVPKVGTLVGVWVALLCATALTTAVSYLELGWLNIVVALLIVKVIPALAGYHGG